MKPRHLYPRRHTLALALLLLAGWNLPLARGETKLAAALAAAKSQNSELAEQLFAGLVKADPKNNLYLFNYGNALFLRQNYTRAAEAYRQVAASSSPLALPARLYLAKCQRKLGLNTAAQATLAQIPRGDLGPALGRELDSELEALRPARIFYPSAKLAIGYDSNFYADPSNQASSPSHKAVFDTDALLTHRLAKRETWAWTNRYSLSFDGPFSPAPDRTFSYSLESELALARGRDLLVLTPSFSHYFLNTARYYLQPGAALGYRHYNGPAALGLNYRFGRPLALDSTYSFLTGQTHEFNASWNRTAGAATYGALFSIELNHTADYLTSTTLIPLRYTGFGPSLLGTYSLGRWDLSARFDYRRRLYTNAFQPGSEKRKDHFFAASLAGERKLTEELAVFTNLNLAWNHSTMGPSAPADKNYNQVAALAGLHWSLP